MAKKNQTTTVSTVSPVSASPAFDLSAITSMMSQQANALELLKAELAKATARAAEAEAMAAKAKAETAKKVVAITFKVSEKGGVSVYGIGRFPVTLYRNQWERFLGEVDGLRAFMKAHEKELSVR